MSDEKTHHEELIEDNQTEPMCEPEPPVFGQKCVGPRSMAEALGHARLASQSFGIAGGAEDISIQEIMSRFIHHEPKPGQPQKYRKIRALARDLAVHLCLEVPPSRELDQALLKLEECVMFANAGIARRG